MSSVTCLAGFTRFYLARVPLGSTGAGHGGEIGLRDAQAYVFWRLLPTRLGKKFGGVEGDRTLDLRIANATLSQLSYHPGITDCRARILP